MSTQAIPWWQKTVVYQIYPRSFQDSNNDGIGDIPGIIKRLDYLQSLGVETIWFSPFFSSPQADFGYDISNYKSIAPEYGTMQDVNALIEGIHQRGMKLIFDMVMNHTSDQHPWFQVSKSSRTNPKADWYIWRDKPTNWKSIVWGKGWQYSADRNQWYYASFLPFQPDLNYQNPEVKKEMFDTVRFWLDKGVDGFRLDIFNCIIKDPQFRDNPFSLNPFPSVESPGGNFQQRKYSLNQPGNFEFARELRAVLNEYGPDEKFLVGEVFGSQDTVSQYLGQQDGLHLIFLFETLYFKLKASWFRKTIRSFEENFPAPFIPTWVLGNHDIYRYSRRIDNDLRKARIMALLQLTVRAVPVLYYGEEIGMANGNIDFQKAKDPLARTFSWIPAFVRNLLPVSVNRDVCRTPMQWDNTRHAGFSNTQPWLPTGPDEHIRNVKSMSDNPETLLNWYKQLIQLRKENPCLHAGTLRLLNEYPDEILAYERTDDLGIKLLILINFSGKALHFSLHSEGKILVASDSTVQLSNGQVVLPAHSGIVIQ